MKSKCVSHKTNIILTSFFKLGYYYFKFLKEHVFLENGSAIFLLIMNTNYQEAKNFDQIQKRRYEN